MARQQRDAADLLQVGANGVGGGGAPRRRARGALDDRLVELEGVLGRAHPRPSVVEGEGSPLPISLAIDSVTRLRSTDSSRWRSKSSTRTAALISRSSLRCSSCRESRTRARARWRARSTRARRSRSTAWASSGVLGRRVRRSVSRSAPASSRGPAQHVGREVLVGQAARGTRGHARRSTRTSPGTPARSVRRGAAPRCAARAAGVKTLARCPASRAAAGARDRSSRSATRRTCSSRSADGPTAPNTGASCATSRSLSAAELHLGALQARSSPGIPRIGIASPAMVLKLSGPASERRSQGSLSSGSRTTLRSTPAACSGAPAPAASPPGPSGRHRRPARTSRASRASSPTCSSVSAVPIEATAFAKPGLVQGEHVRVALDHEHPTLAAWRAGGRGRCRTASGPCGRPAPRGSSRTSAAGCRASRARRSRARARGRRAAET